MKIVLNKEYGGFCLSDEQAVAYGINPDDFQTFGSYRMVDRKPDGTVFERTDTKLIEVVEQGLPDSAFAKLVVVEIPDTAYYKIEEFDGFETLVWSESPINFV